MHPWLFIFIHENTTARGPVPSKDTQPPSLLLPQKWPYIYMKDVNSAELNEKLYYRPI